MHTLSWPVFVTLLGLASAPAAASDTWAPDEVPDALWRDATAAWTCASSSGEARKDVLAVIDYSQPSNERRLWVLDMARGEVVFNERVAHGKNSGNVVATSFSNRVGSNQTSLGLYRAAETYVGSHGRSLKLDGLEPSNDNARERRVVIHSASYVDEAFIEKYGRLGRSYGCPSLDPDVAQDVIDVLADGALVLAWHPDPSWRDNSPWLSCESGSSQAVARRR